MLLRELLIEQNRDRDISTSGEKLLYRSLDFERAAEALRLNHLQVKTDDHGYDVLKGSFVSFSRSPNNFYNRDNLDINVTFEVDQEKLERQLQKRSTDTETNRAGYGRSYKLGPFSFSKFHLGELETRLDLAGDAPIKNLNKFVRAIHIVPTQDMITIAQFDNGEMPSIARDGTPTDVASYKKYIDILRDKSQQDVTQFIEIVNRAKQLNIRLHVYENRNNFLNKVVNKSIRPKRLIGRFFDLAKLIVSRGRLR